MEVRYKREVNHNYMILDAPSEGGGYECRMLASNTIEGLLRFRVRQYEDKREFYYEITSRQPLNRLLEQRKINGGEIRSILLSLSRVLSKIEEYLLKEQQILLEPEFIYIEPDRFTVSLCLLPGYSCDFPAALSELLRFLLEKINHKDREGVVMAYNLYHESLRENYGMSDLLRHLRETENVLNPVIKQESWRFQPESVTEYRQRKAEEDRQEELHAQENGTALLTQDEDKNRFPLFESINREEENIEITYVPFVIGKHPELADFCIRHSTVSRLHLRVDKREGVYIITDLNSTNGTSVGGYKLQANETVSIQNRDVITVADLKYYFIETYEG